MEDQQKKYLYVGGAATVASIFWYMARMGERNKLAKMLAENEQVSKVISLRLVQWDPATKAAETIKVTNMVTATQAYYEIIQSLPDVPWTADLLESVKEGIEDIAGMDFSRKPGVRRSRRPVHENPDDSRTWDQFLTTVSL